MRFFRLFNALGKLGTGVIAIILAVFGLYNHLVSDVSEIKQLENLYASETTAIVELDSNVREVHAKIAGVDIVSYEVNYSFTAKGKAYTGQYRFEEEEEIFSEEHEVYYLPEDPSVNQLNLEEELADLQEQHKSNLNFFIWIGVIIFGIVMIYLGQKKFKENMKRKKVDERDLEDDF